MLDISFLKSATQASDAGSAQSREETGAAKRDADDRFEAAYDATRKRPAREPQDAAQNETVAVEQTSAKRSDTTEDAGKDNIDGAPKDSGKSEVEALNVKEDGTAAVGLVENSKLPETAGVASRDVRSAVPKVAQRADVAKAVGRSASEGDAVGRSTSEGDPVSAPAPERPERTQGGPIEPKTNATASETIISAKVVESALVRASGREREASAAPRMAAGASGDAKAVRATNSTAATRAQRAELLPKSVVGHEMKANLDTSPRQDIEARMEPKPAQPRAAFMPTAAIQHFVAQTANQHQKLEAMKDKTESLSFSLNDLEGLSAVEPRSMQQASHTSLSQVLTRADTPAMIGRQMAEALQKLPDKPVEISLNPRELGRVRMSLSVAEAGINVTVIAERPETLDLMRRNIEQLAREFEMIGYSDINFAFSEGETQAGFGGDTPDGDLHQASRLEVMPDPEDQTTPQQTAVASTGVDIRL